MNGLSHKQARRYLQADLDGLLSDAQRLDLQTHLAGCEACRAESESLSTLTSRLQSDFHERWDAQDGPSHNVMKNVRSQTRRIAMSNKINLGLRTLGGIAVLLILGFGLNAVISQLRDHSVAANGTNAPDNNMPVSTKPEDRLLAFTMERDGNLDVYTVHADGTGLTNLTNSPEREDNPYWSPDGKRIAFNGTIKDQQQIFLMDTDGSNIIQLTEDGSFNKLVSFEEGRESGFDAWSPDGKKLVFVKEDFSQANTGRWMKLYVLDVETKTETPLTSDWGLYMSPAWSPDGLNVAFTSITTNGQGEPNRMSVDLVAADGSNFVDLTASLPDDVFPSLNHWSRDGQSIFFSVSGITHDKDKLYEARLDGSLVERASGNGLRLLAWWGGGITLFRESNVVPLILRRADGTETSLDACQNGREGQRFSSSLSNAGDLFFSLYCPEGKWMMYLANEDGSQVKQLFDGPIAFVNGGVGAAWSPDSQYIAFNLSSTEKTEMYILNVGETLNNPSTRPFMMDVGDIFSFADGITWQPVIPEKTVDAEPTQTASHDGLIAFTSAVENGNLDIYTMQPDGSGLTNLTNDPAHDINPYWSPDGKRIAFLSDRAGYMQIFTMKADGSDVFQVTNREADHGFSNLNPWSPDGSTLVFVEKTSDGKQILYTMQVNGRNGIPLVSQPDIYQAISWSPDGGHIAYIALEPAGDRDMARIHVVDANGDNNTNVTNLLPDDEDLYSWAYTWTQRGRSISFIAGRIAWENNNGKFAAYEATLDGKTLVELAETSTPLEDWWEGTAFVRGFTGETLTWLRPDGTFSELKPFEMCQMGTEPQYSSFSRRSLTGYVLFGAGCPNGDLWLYWANPDGTDVRQLLTSPIDAADGGLNGIDWSPDGGYVTLTVSSSGITHLYVLDVREALKNPLSPPEPIAIGAGDINYTVSWQPMP